jgi:hypothetical protein
VEYAQTLIDDFSRPDILTAIPENAEGAERAYKDKKAVESCWRQLA